MHRLVVLLSIVLLSVSIPARADGLPPGGSFLDDDRSVHEGAIEALAASEITNGCAPGRYCPLDPVQRGAMAAFLYRALDLVPADGVNVFSDDDGSPFETEIDALAAEGIATGCDVLRFCPERPVSRAEMASFLVRAFVGPGEFDPVPDAFTDDEDSVHEADIDRIAALGITLGCAEGRFCPAEPVTRAEMASFIVRAAGLESVAVPPRPPARPLASFTTHHNCCESRVTNIHVMADQLDGIVVQPGEVFSLNDRLGPRREADGYVPAGILLDGELYCCDHPLNIGGGTSQVATTLYNAIFRNGFEVIDHKPHSRYISRYPLGIEATLGYPWPDIVFRNDTFTPVTLVTSYSSTSITIGLVGDDLGRVTEWEVFGSATYGSGGSVTVHRSITSADGDTRIETWGWTYLGE